MAAEHHAPGAQPPYDLAAEKSVLRAMLRSRHAVTDLVELLDGDDFYRPGHGLIYRAVLALHARDTAPDPFTVSAELQQHGHLTDAGGADYLHDLATSARSTGSWTKAADTIHSLAVLRRLREATAHIDNLAADGTATDAERLIDTAHTELHAATSRRSRPIPPSRPLADVLEGALDEMEAVGHRPGQPYGIPTGFHDLDALTGGLHPGQLVVLAGRPAMGTSTLVLNFLRHASIEHGLPAALFALEARSTDIAMRLLAAEARVPLHHLRSGTMTDADWNRIALRLPNVTAAPLYLQDDLYAGFTELRAHARRLHRLHGLKLLAVDHLQLLNYGTRPLGSRYEEVSEIARSLKHLAKELHLPVIAVSTLNRSPEQRDSRRPLLSDLRDSGALEDSADLVVFLHREAAYEKDSPRVGEADLIVARQRYGPSATLVVAEQLMYGRFVNMQPDPEAPPAPRTAPDTDTKPEHATHSGETP